MTSFVSGAVVSTVRTRVAGLGSVFPASSVARTAKVCSPSSSFVYACGEEHFCQGPPSSRQLKVECGSLEANPNEASAETTGPDGPDVIVVWGARRSTTVHERDAGEESRIPAASRANTWNVCEPSASPR